MILKRPVDYFNDDKLCWSPLWRRFGEEFQREFLARVGDADYIDSDLYVSQREPADGIDEGDVHKHVCGDTRRLLLIAGPGGGGKSTFLHHVMKRYDNPEYAIVFVDLLFVISLGNAEGYARLVAEHISATLEKYITTEARPNLAWLQYFLRRCSDPRGLASVIADELATTNQLSERGRDVLLELLRATDSSLSELVSLKLAFLCDEARRRPVIVVDNVDQLPTRAIEDILLFSAALAAGHPGAAWNSDPHVVRVIVAMRPLSIPPSIRSYDTVLLGELRPPSLAKVVECRLDRFAVHAPRRAASVGTRNSSNVFDQLSEERARTAMKRGAELLLTHRTEHGAIVGLLQRLTNYNTRVCLVALAQYVASGHLSWKRIVDQLNAHDRVDVGDAASVISAESAHDRLSIMEMMANTPNGEIMTALFLGVNAVYQSRNSWLYNLFNDGTQDTTGVVIRLRLLKIISTEHKGISSENASRILRLLFGYSEDRITSVWRDAILRGLLHEPSPDAFELDEAGRAYLNSMSKDFIYLQHVLVDAWVDAEHVQRKVRREEAYLDRWLRVLRFADWIRQIEVNEYRRIISSKTQSIYERYFDEDTISQSVCSGILSADHAHAPLSQGEREALLKQTALLNERCTFRAIEREAMSDSASG